VTRLAIITSHPIQYFAPWFRFLTAQSYFSLKVFYLWNAGVRRTLDVGFQQHIQWDIPLLDGYDYEFVENRSGNPGTHHFWGLRNPTLLHKVKEYNPDAVLMMCYNYAAPMSFIARWDRKKTPLLFRGDSHRLLKSSESNRERLRQVVIKNAFKRFDAFLYVGKANYNYFRLHGVPENKLFFAPHAVDNDRFMAVSDIAQREAFVWKKELGIPDDHAVILFAGKFEEKKRPADLLRAFLKADLKDISLLFVGSGPLEGMLKTLAENHSNIYFAPFQNQSFMPRTYAAADIFVLPSYGPAETWGLAINEAMCLARPIIASSHVGCAQDLVRHGENGLVFPAGDVDALATSLQTALLDKERLRRWSDKSFEMIKEFSYAQSTKGLMDALRYLQDSSR